MQSTERELFNSHMGLAGFLFSIENDLVLLNFTVKVVSCLH